jgi:tetratricopeptide (TPR) repeat protein
MPAPIAFLVMPFDTKPTGRSEAGVPTEVDFDALWYRVYQPVLSDMGYEAVRADRDVGALIISEMIQRLALADLVVADVSLPNANVYYEIGVRHAAKRVGCVLVAADWAKPVFDLAQLRQLRFPLPDGAIGEEAAAAAKAVLVEGLGPLIEGSSPVFDAVEGFPDSSPDRASAFREQVAQLSAFNADVRAARVAPTVERRAKALEVVERHGRKRAIQEAVGLELVGLLRDLVGWQEMLDYVDTLPKNVARHPLVLEQRALALAKSGDPADAVGRLEELIDGQGPTPERLGLLGGRYKELYRGATVESDCRRYLELAIEAYERGMLLDLNSYYNASNLARLYRERDEPGDAQRAAETQLITMRAANRAIDLGIADEWARPTLLGCAFERRDVDEARRLLKDVQREGAGSWKLQTTLVDLESDVASQPDDDIRRALDEVLEGLRRELAGVPVGGG